MRFTKTPLPGAWIIDIEPMTDARGFFARSHCTEEFERRGLNGRMVEQSISWNATAGTLRGLHFQAAPFAEEKLVRVTRGSVYDVIVDLRRDSPTRGRWFGTELSADNRRQLYIPQGVAHGYQTLVGETEIFYQMTAPYRADAARGVRWDDPELGIAWPAAATAVMSERDRALPPLRDLDACGVDAPRPT